MNRFLLAGVLFLLLLNLYQCSNSRDEARSNRVQLEALTDQIKYYKDGQGRTIAEKKLFSDSVLELSQFQGVLTPNQTKLHTEARNVPKGSLKAAVQVQEVVEVPELTATKIDSNSYAYSDSLVSFTTTVRDTTLTLDSLRLYNDKTILLLEDRKGTRLQVTNSNPYFRSADIDGILIPEKKRFLNSKTFKVTLFISGFAAGIYFAR